MPDKTCNVDIDDYDYVDEKDDGDKYDYLYDDDLSLLVPASVAAKTGNVAIDDCDCDDNGYDYVDDKDDYDRDKDDDEEGLIG